MHSPANSTEYRLAVSSREREKIKNVFRSRVINPNYEHKWVQSNSSCLCDYCMVCLLAPTSLDKNTPLLHQATTLPPSLLSSPRLSFPKHVTHHISTLPLNNFTSIKMVNAGEYPLSLFVRRLLFRPVCFPRH